MTMGKRDIVAVPGVEKGKNSLLLFVSSLTQRAVYNWDEMGRAEEELLAKVDLAVLRSSQQFRLGSCSSSVC